MSCYQTLSIQGGHIYQKWGFCYTNIYNFINRKLSSRVVLIKLTIKVCLVFCRIPSSDPLSWIFMHEWSYEDPNYFLEDKRIEKNKYIFYHRLILFNDNWRLDTQFNLKQTEII